jgi:opacity protein-like surface antigen
MKKLLTGAALAVVLATPAFAADMIQQPEPAPAPVVTAPAFSWTGFYVGGQLGYGWAKADPGSDDGSFVGGPNVGYNYDLGNWVVGAELDYNFANMNFDNGVGIDGIGSAKVKIGADLGRTLLYGTGGVAYSGVDNSDSKAGYVVGAGIDYALTQHTFIGAEYDFNHFSGLHADSTGADSDVDVHEITARIGYKF